MILKEVFEKQGGIELIKRYWKGGAFFTACNQFLILGRNRTALELLSLSAELKVKQKLKKKYKHILDEFNKTYDVKLPHIQSNKVWLCWFQGIENAPNIVKRCYLSIKENLSDKEIILITSDNMSKYVQFPEFIVEKWKKGIISHAHMTDILRLELLIRYGGTWVDSTVFCSNNNIPDYMFESDLFFFQILKPGRDGHSINVSSWFISAKSNNKVLMAVQAMIYAYWKENNIIWDYFLLHDFISVVSEYYSKDWNRIIPRDNAPPHMLLLRLFDQYDEQMWQAIKAQTPFHKMTYKFNKEQIEIKGTYYDTLFG